MKATWLLVAPESAVLARSFYSRLFAIDPGAAALFQEVDMAVQGRRFMQALGTLVQGLDDDAISNEILEDMGIRHVHYGVAAAQYDTFGAALLWALQRALGRDWTADTADAWSAAYARIAEGMGRGARKA
ncbi:MAG: globin domain-containing protein [Alphaproteobacteria bacterium]